MGNSQQMKHLPTTILADSETSTLAQGTITEVSRIAINLGFRNDQLKKYVNRVAELKKKYIPDQHLEFIEGLEALNDRAQEKV